MDVPWSTIKKQQPICVPIWGSQDFNPVPWIALGWWWLMKVSGWWAGAPKWMITAMIFMRLLRSCLGKKAYIFVWLRGGNVVWFLYFIVRFFFCEKLRDIGWSASNLCRFTLSIDESKFKFQYLHALIMWYDIITYDQCMYVVYIYTYISIIRSLCLVGNGPCL